LQEAADDAYHANILAQFRNAGPQAANAANDQIDFHTGTGSFVKLLNDFLIHQCVQLGDNSRWFAGNRVVTFALDESNDATAHIEWGNNKFLQARVTGQTG